MHTYWRILRYVKPYWLHLSGSIGCIFFFTVFNTASLLSVMPFLRVIFYAEEFEAQKQESSASGQSAEKQDIIERSQAKLRTTVYGWFMSADRRIALARLCIVIIVLILLKNIFDYVQAYAMAYVEQGVIKDLRNDLYRHLNLLSLSYFNKTRTGQLISRITNDVTLINGGLSASLVTLVKYPLLFFASLATAFYLSWQLTLVALLILPFSLVIISSIGLRLRKHSTRSQEKLADVTAVLQETISGARVVKAFAMEDFEIRKFMRETLGYFKALLRISRVRGLAAPVNEFLTAVVAIGILWFGGQKVLAGDGLDPEVFITFLLVIFSLVHPIKELSTVNSRVQEALAAAQRVFEVLDEPLEIVSSPQARRVTAFEHSIRFENVDFSYDRGVEVLRGVNLEVEKGEILAIVGPSGAGKSTLVDLLPRFYDPTGGRILLDGHDLRDLTLPSLRQLLGIVTQETILFHDTIRNNIAYGLQDVPQSKLIEAAQAANAHRFISEMPGGYDTVIGERGVKLSGGQRQRLAIARALLKNPPILILDEATSALDSESEMLVQQAIERLMVNRTSFVIAHRLSTILHAHQIIVLDKGRIVQRGNHDELLRHAGVYRKLYEMQFRA
jgi:subfamily B ATP-binding cassette protein MsbA